MKKTTVRDIFLLLVMTVVSASAWWGCGEKDVPFVVDEDELIRYIGEVAQARELFRTSGLIRTDPYTVPFDNGTYSDSLLGRTRNFFVSLVTDKQSIHYYTDYGSLGLLREAYVAVTDSLRIQTTRTYPDTTLVDTTYRDLTRYGFFLKLGDDAHSYVGWSLWGYNGIGDINLPVTVEAERFDLSKFRCDLAMYTEMPKSTSSTIPKVPFVRLVNIDTVVEGSRLRFHTEKLSNNPATYLLVSDYADDGPFISRMIQADSPDTDSLSYKTESAATRYYRMAFFQAFTENQGDFVGAWCVPYRQ